MPDPAHPVPTTFAVVEIGIRAREMLAAAADFRIAAVFERSFYLSDGDRRFVCVGFPSIGRGPLNAIIQPGLDASWSELGVAIGQIARLAPDRLIIPDSLCLDMSATKIWRPLPWPPRMSQLERKRMFTRLRDFARHEAPADGLLPIVLRTARATLPIARALQRSAGLAIATLCDWLDAAEADAAIPDQIAEHATHRLIGLGSGLTPSGDDLLAGILISLHALGRLETARRLGAFVERAPADATSALSRAFLDCARAGWPAETLYNVIAATHGGTIEEMELAIGRLASTGHTSGWDMLAGVIIAHESDMSRA